MAIVNTDGHIYTYKYEYIFSFLSINDISA